MESPIEISLDAALSGASEPRKEIMAVEVSSAAQPLTLMLAPLTAARVRSAAVTASSGQRLRAASTGSAFFAEDRASIAASIARPIK
jgi:hypothetical protein